MSRPRSRPLPHRGHDLEDSMRRCFSAGGSGPRDAAPMDDVLLCVLNFGS